MEKLIKKKNKTIVNAMVRSIALGIGIVLVCSFRPLETPTDYKLHTLYIFNFLKSTEWPARSGEFIIGVVGSKEAEEYLSKMAKIKSSASQQIVVRNVDEEADSEAYQIIFIPSVSSGKAGKLISKFNSKPVLLITEEADMTKKGAGISFKLIDSKLHFQINEAVIKSSGLKMSSSIISLAEK